MLDKYLRIAIKLGLALILFLPLVVGDGYYFPFIVPRNLYFRLVVDIIFGLYLWLSFRSASYRVSFNKGFILFFIFVLGLTLSSVLGGHFSFSFWSNFERMDGLANWYHILMYMLVLMGILKTLKDWFNFFKISLLAALVVALVSVGQALQLDFLIKSYGGSRLTSTLGNAAYVGAYMFLHIVVAFYFLVNAFKTKSKLGWKIAYIASIILYFYALVSSDTRAPFLALFLFLFLLAVFFLITHRRQRNIWYHVTGAGLVLSVVFICLLFVQKDSAWVQNVAIFRKVANISVTDSTTQTRLLLWQNSLTAVKEKPILGWGEENFLNVISAHFPIEVYRGLSSEVWFDRPHNVLVQHLVHGGILGLGLYLAVFGYLIFVLYKKRDWFWIAFLLSFLFHDLFLFDNLNTNIILYLILAYLFKTGVKDKETPKNIRPATTNYILLPIIFVVTVGLVFIFYANPRQSNRLLIKSSSQMSRATSSAEFNIGLDNWEKSFDLTALGDKEKVQLLLQISGTPLNNPALTNEDKIRLVNVLQDRLNQLAAKYPDDIRFNLFLSSFYTMFSVVNQEFIQQNIDLLKNLQARAPSRPDVYFMLTNAYLSADDTANAESIARQLIDLAPGVTTVYWNLAQVALYDYDLATFSEALDKIIEINTASQGMPWVEDEVQRLEALLAQAEQNSKTELIILLQSYLAK